MRGQHGVVLLGSLLSFWLTPLAGAEPALLRAVDALDEPRGYCIDIPGSGPTINLDAPLQGHTCKFRDAIADQLFDEADGQHVRAQRVRPLHGSRSARARSALVVAELCRFAPATLATRERPPEPRNPAHALCRARRRTRRALGHAAARHAGLSPANTGTRRVRRRRGQYADVPLVAARRAGVEQGRQRAGRHARGRRRGARGVRPRIRRRNRTANGGDLCHAAARLRAGRNRGREGSCLRPARAPASRCPHTRDPAGRPGAGDRRVPRRRADRRQPRRDDECR